MGLLPGAAQAELAVIHERLALAIPESMSFPAAGGFTETFATAYDAIVIQGGLGLGSRLLINGAAGGVGTAAIDLAHAAGANVVASVRDPHRRAELADQQTTVVAPEKAFDHGPYDIILELVGAPNLGGDIRALATSGVLVVIGISAGARAELDLRELMSRRAKICSSSLRSRSLEEKARLIRELEHHVLPGIVSGALTVRIDRTFVFTQAPEAYEHFQRGGKLGKTILIA
jgi:NADPH:quinone reductase-like Zn-dependent oxidoreductase